VKKEGFVFFEYCSSFQNLSKGSSNPETLKNMIAYFFINSNASSDRTITVCFGAYTTVQKMDRVRNCYRYNNYRAYSIILAAKLYTRLLDLLSSTPSPSHLLFPFTPAISMGFPEAFSIRHFQQKWRVRSLWINFVNF